MKMMVTGGSGFLGARIARHYQGQYECLVPSRGELDITDPKCCLGYMDKHRPDCVIHAAAVSDIGTCERYPERSMDINVNGTMNLARACAVSGSRMVFMSSDQVYNGGRGTKPNRETDPCEPANVYAKHKLAAEQQVLALLPEAIALRLSWMYDLPTDQLGTKDNFLTNLMAGLEKKEPMFFSDQEYRGITYVDEVVRNISKLFQIPGGVYNFGSHTGDTTYGLAMDVVRMLGAESEGLVVPMPHARARNLNVDPCLINRYGIYFSDNYDGICKCLKEHGMRTGFR